MTTAGTETKTLGQKAVDRFTEMMIERMEQMKSVGWHKGWIGGATAPGAMPQNVSGRGYSGSNSFFLQLDTALRGYSMPVYLTFKQANDLGTCVKKGESAMPVLYWDIMARDKDGMEYYSTALHEMAHSTGTEPRLNRGSHEKFGDAKYAKEELVAELTAAMVGNSMGFDKRILDNNAAYLDGWISTLKENPKFIVSVIADVNKAANMVLEEVDKQKMALGEEPLLDKNRNLSTDIPKDKVVFENASIIKQNDGDYAVRASFQGQDLGLKPIDRNVGILYFSLAEETEKARLLSHTLEKSYGDIILSQGQRRSHGIKI